MARLDPERLRGVHSFPSLLEYLTDVLDWPIDECEPDDLTFEWDADSLRVEGPQAEALSHGHVRQLRSMTSNQPWGIFLVEFNDDRVHRGLLREILRGLVARQRRDPNLPAWQHDNLLFICATQDYNRLTFAHFRGEKTQKARLATFGWQQGSPYLRTLCEFNLPALRWPSDPADSTGWLKAWAAAFDKEPLTREFFKRFDKMLEAIKADLEEYQSLHPAAAYSRAQLLLERLLFLYFLQNRGWLNRQRDYLLKNFPSSTVTGPWIAATTASFWRGSFGPWRQRQAATPIDWRVSRFSTGGCSTMTSLLPRPCGGRIIPPFASATRRSP